MVLQNTTKGTNNEKLPINNSQKTEEIIFLYSRLYRVELVKNISKIGFLEKVQDQGRWGILFVLGEYLIIINVDSITMVGIQTYTLPFISVTLAVYTVQCKFLLQFIP